MRSLFIVVLIVSISTYAQCQFAISGKVIYKIDSLEEALPVVSVQIKNTKIKTTTDIDGEFSIKAESLPATLVFKYYGFLTKELVVSDAYFHRVEMVEDTATLNLELYSNHHIKNSLMLGYYADARNAGMGIAAQYSLQSIGKTTIELHAAYKNWWGNNNHGYQVSISKKLPWHTQSSFIPSFINANQEQLRYQKEGFNYTRRSVQLTNFIPSRFLDYVDWGLSHNQSSNYTIEKVIEAEDYLTASVGLTKSFYTFGRLSGLKLYTSADFSANTFNYHAGLSKKFGIAGKVYGLLNAKYFTYEDLNGIILGLVFNIFSTRSYCCHSPTADMDELNLLR